MYITSYTYVRTIIITINYVANRTCKYVAFVCCALKHIATHTSHPVSYIAS